MWKSIGAATAVAFLSVAACAAEPQSRSEEKAAANEGRALYLNHCASCHGTSARGDGPLSDVLRVPPPDLTQLAHNNGGVFVAARIERIVDGREVLKAHGSSEMPVWGDTFKRREGLDNRAIRVRIEAIVGYLKSIQARLG
jgi:mono/diheme cytochrome c family protein